MRGEKRDGRVLSLSIFPYLSSRNVLALIDKSMYVCHVFAITNCHKLGEFKQYRFILNF
jgi:hypothetical protein